MSLLNDLTMQLLLSRITGFLLYVALHGCILAVLATMLGAQGPARDGRLTLNPLAHLSMPGLAMAVLFRSGWSRPMHIAHEELRGGRIAMIAIAIAALAISLLMVPLLDLLRPLIASGLPRTAGYAVLQAIIAFQDVTLASVALNALPLPGLTAGLVLQALLPATQTKRFYRMEVPVAALLVIALVAGWLPDPMPLMRLIIPSL